MYRAILSIHLSKRCTYFIKVDDGGPREQIQAPVGLVIVVLCPGSKSWMDIAYFQYFCLVRAE